MMKYHKKYKTGFTLVESLVAVSIFTGSLLGIIVLSSQGIVDTGYAKRKVIASYLAQEGIEYIHNLRYSYVLYDETLFPPSGSTQAGWDKFRVKLLGASFNTLCSNLSTGCFIVGDNLNYSDSTQPMIDIFIRPCTGSLQCRNLSSPNLGIMYYDSNTGKYNNSIVGTDSGFSRKITVTQVGSPVNELKVTSTVYWLKQGSSSSYNSVSFTESIFNWNE